MDTLAAVAEICTIVAIPIMAYQLFIAREQLRDSRSAASTSVQSISSSVTQTGIEVDSDAGGGEQVRANSIPEAFRNYKDVKRSIRWGDNLTDYVFIRDFWARVRMSVGVIFVALMFFISGTRSPPVGSLLVSGSIFLGLLGFGSFQWSYARLKRRFPAPARSSSSIS